MDYQEWLAGVPREITDDPLWKSEVYRLALLFGDLAWRDGGSWRKSRHFGRWRTS